MKQSFQDNKTKKLSPDNGNQNQSGMAGIKQMIQRLAKANNIDLEKLLESELDSRIKRIFKENYGHQQALETEAPVESNNYLQKKRRLSTEQAASYLGYTSKTLKWSRHVGRLGGVDAPPFYKQGRACFYELGDLDKWRERFERFRNTAEAQA